MAFWGCTVRPSFKNYKRAKPRRAPKNRYSYLEERQSSQHWKEDKMKLLKASGWILGIFLLGIIVGHVTAQKKCYTTKKGDINYLTLVKDIADAMKATTVPDCGAKNCVQYHPKETGFPNAGELRISFECAESCQTENSKIQEKVGLASGTSGYTCAICVPESTVNDKCKTLEDLTKTTKATLCYKHEANKVTAGEVDKIPQVYCFDKCQYSTMVNTSHTKVFMGCAQDCATYKNSGPDAVTACAECQGDTCKSILTLNADGGGSDTKKDPKKDDGKSEKGTTKVANHGKKITSSTSVVILLFAASQCMRL